MPQTVFSGDIVDGEVKTADLANNAVTAAKIKDNEVKAAEIAANAVGSSEIATDAVGAAELQGVTKLSYGQCKADSTESSMMIMPNTIHSIVCSISGVDRDDSAVVTMNGGSECFVIRQAIPDNGYVGVILVNHCTITVSLGTSGAFGIIVFDK